MSDMPLHKTEDGEEIDRLRAELAEARRVIDEARKQEPFGFYVTDSQHNAEDFVRSATFDTESTETVIPLFCAAPVPAQPAVPAQIAVQFNHADGTATRFDLTPAMEESRVREALVSLGWTPPGAQPAVPDDVAKDARLGNRLYVWDYDNPEDGSWDNIEEYLHDTTPNVGEVVRLNLAMPLQDVEVKMLEVGKCGEPIQWEVRDVKTGAVLSAAETEVKNGTQT